MAACAQGDDRSRLADPLACDAAFSGRQPYFRLDRAARYLAAAFLVYGLVAVALLAVNMPPFQNPDEPNHFQRAAQLADGHVIGTRFTVQQEDGSSRITGGGLVDPAVLAASAPFDRLPFQPDRKTTRADWSPKVHWSEARVTEDFYNTILYPPPFYLPSVAGILIGRATDRTVLQTLVISRLLTGTAAVAVGAVAIALADGAAIWIFALLTLPMSLSQIASVSQDALLLSCSALAGALLLRAFRRPDKQHPLELPLLVGLLTLMAAARPPYAALSVLLLALPGLRLRWRIAALAIVITGVTGWLTLIAVTAWSNQSFFLGTDPVAQLRVLQSDPLAVIRIAAATLAQHGHSYLVEFVGKLGWLDTSLPGEYHVAARVMLGVAAIAAMLGLTGGRIGVGARAAIGLGVLLSAAGVFAVIYLTWPVGNPVVDGVQGRYFLPIALAGTAFLPAIGRGRWAPHYNRLLIAVAAFPPVSLAVIMQAVISRYYLS
jgi:uncharacterized membrane protein